MQMGIYTYLTLIAWFGAKAIVGSKNGTVLSGIPMTTGDLQNLISYSMMILMSLMMLSMVYVMIMMSRESVSRIREILKEQSSIVNPENPDKEIRNGEIVFDHVGFSYIGDPDRLCLSDIDLHIRSGETIGIIGGTGSGKSSLVQLIPRLYDATVGTVTVGGKNVKEYDLESLRDAVAMVLQKNVLFAGSIKENLRWGNPDATDEELIEVCQLAQADSFISSFPDGYDTHIEQGGTNVSGGQKQRLCIARALLKHPKILILNDSTSAVDTKTDALFFKMQTFPIRFFDTHTHGDIMSVYTNDTDTLRQFIAQSLPMMISSLVTIVFAFCFMLRFSLILTGIVVILSAVMILAARAMVRYSGKYFSLQQDSTGAVNGYIEEMFGGLKVVKVFCHEDAAKARLRELNEELYITLTAQQMNSAVLGFAGAGRIFDLMDNEPEEDEVYVTLVRAREKDGQLEECEDGDLYAWKHPHHDGTLTYARVQGNVVFDHVDFSYDGRKLVLHDISLYAKPGQKIAFVGATGAGKTTITNLINRFYDLADGKIRYDGINITKIKKSDLRRSMGMILQDVSLFTGTVMDNIRYGKLDATDEECIAAAKLSGADSFISRLPNGYQTMINGDNNNLSQGQCQLISIARAAVADLPVMIMDEATSSIDTRTEAIVQKGMDALMDGRTVFVIAHRLSTVRNSKAIMVLEQGRIIERGSHEQLIEEKGQYYQLYTGAFELE